MFLMAITQKDAALKARIKNLMKQFVGKPDKEAIYAIAGVCGISQRTTSEHFHAFKAQQALKEFGFKEKCEHDWSQAFGTAGGLVKECRLCGRTEEVGIHN